MTLAAEHGLGEELGALRLAPGLRRQLDARYGRLGGEAAAVEDETRAAVESLLASTGLACVDEPRAPAAGLGGAAAHARGGKRARAPDEWRAAKLRKHKHVSAGLESVGGRVVVRLSVVAPPGVSDLDRMWAAEEQAKERGRIPVINTDC